jgi:hypothetical protein
MRFVVAVALLWIGTLCSPAWPGDKSSLANRLAPLAKAHKGNVAIAVKHLDTGHGWTLNLRT